MKSLIVACVILFGLPFSFLSCTGTTDNQARKTTDRRAPTPAIAADIAQEMASYSDSTDSSEKCYDQELYVTNLSGNSIVVFSLAASGDAAPLRKIAGSLTGLAGPAGIALDTINNEIYVANASGTITVYFRGASGNVAPVRVISAGGPPMQSLPVYGVVADTENNELIVTRHSNNSIAVYSRTASGDTAPLRTISGASTGINGPYVIAADTVNNELYAVNGYGNSITVFSRTASGNVVPLRTLSGSATGLNNPYGIAVDTVNNEIAVTNNLAGSVTVYSRTAFGDVVPLRTIAGSSIGLGTIHGIALDTVNNEFYVNNFGGNAIAVYSRTAAGDAAPLRIISGLATGLNGPLQVAITQDVGFCNSGQACASKGCMPRGSSDCGNGFYCLGGTLCFEGQTATLSCIPSGVVNCGNGYYCAAGAACRQSTENRTECTVAVQPGQGVVCSDGLSCSSGYDCASIGCMPSGSTDCQNGYYCPAEKTCATSANGDVMCDDPADAGGNDNDDCTFTMQQCCAGSPGIAATACAVDTAYVQACGCPSGTTEGGADGPQNTWCICP